jgi:integrase
MLHGRPRFRTVGGGLEAARREREALVAAAQAGAMPASPRLRFATVSGWWIERFEARVTAGERRERTLEAHRYYLSKHLLPALGGHLLRTIAVEDVAKLLTTSRVNGCSEKTTAGVLATLHSILRFALRHGWIVDDPVVKLETDERPHPVRRRQRVLGRGEIRRLLAACLPRYRPLIATALYTGMRTSELLGSSGVTSTFPAAGSTRAPSSRARTATNLHGASRRRRPRRCERYRSCRSSPRCCESTGARQHSPRVRTGCSGPATAPRSATATPSAARCSAQPQSPGWTTGSGRRFASTTSAIPFASHLILDLGLDVAQVARILGHSRITTTLDVYTHLFDEARHAEEIRERMAQSAFARLLEARASGAGAPNLVALSGGRAT